MLRKQVSTFGGAGSILGLQVWGVDGDDFHLIKLPTTEYGKFYMGNSYIILYTGKLLSGETESIIHFWVSKDCTGMEESVVKRVMELDETLGGAHVKYRELQGNESSLFCSRFAGGIRIIPGKLSITEVNESSNLSDIKLYQVKGKRNVKIHEVDASIGSMNKGDCFILDTPTKIWVYIGCYSKRVEKVKAVQAADQIRDQDHGDDTQIQVVDSKSSPEIVTQFFSALGGGAPSDVSDPPEEDDDDKENIASKPSSVTLYLVSDASGAIKVEAVAQQNLSSDMLNSTDCYILHAPSESEIYVWVGLRCTVQEKVEAFGTAEKFLVKEGHSSSAQVQCVSDGREPSAFKKFFSLWKQASSTEDGPVIPAKVTQSPYYISSLVNAVRSAKLLKNLGTAPSFCPDDGSGKVGLWRVEDFQLVPVPPETYGLFFGGDSYVLRYTYGEDKDQYIIYYWQGKQSTQDEIASSALHAVKLDEELELRATLIRVQQGFEPAHFLRIFQGRIIIFLGGHASGFRNLREKNDTYDPQLELARLFHVRSTCPGDTRAVQVELEASSLDSDDVFVLITKPDKLFAKVLESAHDIWIGTKASAEEERIGSEVLNLVTNRDGIENGSVIKLREGEESDEFWGLLGGKGPGVENKEDELLCRPALGPHLFHCSIPERANAKLKVEEVFNFTQAELYEDDVMVLDTGDDEIFIWLGNGATPKERTYSTQMADDYSSNNYTRMGCECTVSIVIKQHYEPDAFKEHFPSWDNDYWKKLGH